MTRALKVRFRPVCGRELGKELPESCLGPWNWVPWAESCQLPAVARSPSLGRKALTVLERADLGTCPLILRRSQRSHDSASNLLIPGPTLESRFFPKNIAEVEFKPKYAWFQSPCSLHSFLGQLTHCCPDVSGRQTNETLRTDTVMTWPSCAVEEGGRKLGQRPMPSAGAHIHN